jgi:hypothetical protein
MKNRAFAWIRASLALVLALAAGTAHAEAPTAESLAERTPAPISFAQDRGAARGEVEDPLAKVRRQTGTTRDPQQDPRVQTAYVQDLYGSMLTKITARLETKTAPVVLSADDYAASLPALERVRVVTGGVAGSVSYDGHFAIVQLPERTELIPVDAAPDPESIPDHRKLLEAALKQLPARLEVSRVRPERVTWNGLSYIIVSGKHVLPPTSRKPTKRPDARVAGR